MFGTLFDALMEYASDTWELWWLEFICCMLLPPFIIGSCFRF